MYESLVNYFQLKGRMNRRGYIKVASILTLLWFALNFFALPWYQAMHPDLLMAIRGIYGANLPADERQMELMRLMGYLTYRDIAAMVLVSESVFLLMLPAFLKRLHDTGMTGYLVVFMYFPSLLSLYGIVVDAKIAENSSFMITSAMLMLAIVLAIKPGEAEDNKYGYVPLSSDEKDTLGLEDKKNKKDK